MKKVINSVVFITQVALTFIVLMGAYMFFALFDYQGGIEGFLSTLTFQPLIGAVFSIITIITCIFVGLPIRLSSRVKGWWQNNYFLSIIGFCVGVLLLTLALFHFIPEQAIYDGVTKEIPNGYLLLSGWFLTAFSLLHTYPPNDIKARLSQVFGWSVNQNIR